MSDIRIAVIEDDALDFKADVLALKYAQGFYGVDQAVYERFLEHKNNPLTRMPDPGDFLLADTQRCLATKEVLFVGVEPLDFFAYEEIRSWAENVLFTLSATSPHVKHIALTAHGLNNGLDAQRTVVAEIDGLLDAIQDGCFPYHLERLTLIEQESYRVLLIRRVLADIIHQGIFFLNENGGYVRLSLEDEP